MCGACNQEMTDQVGCTLVRYTEDETDRIPYPADEEGPCHDCGAPPGSLHHPGCDDERCPRCGGQVISCGCAEPDEDAPYYDDYDDEY